MDAVTASTINWYVSEADNELLRLLRPSTPALGRIIRQYHRASLRAAVDHLGRAFEKAQRHLTELASLNVNEFQADKRAKQPAVGSDKIGIEVVPTTA